MLKNLQEIASTLRLRANEVNQFGAAIDRVRFCRNVQRTIERDETENARRLAQLLEALDNLLSL